MAGQRRTSSVDVDDSAFLDGLRRAMGDLRLDGERGLLRLALRVQNAARELCPVDTGRLRSSIVHVPGRDARGFYVDVGTNVEYAPDVEFGTAPHRIEPTKAHGLLGAKGGFGPVRGGVDHPGTTAQPYLRPALAEAVGYAPRVLGGR